MRLTLRTLLAYRDGALSCVDASDIERQLSGSRTAQAMLRRLERLQKTPNSDPLQKALALDVDVVFFLTDGVIPASTTMIGPSASRSHTTIHTVGFKTRKGELLLQQIAADSGGVYRFVE